MNRRAQAVVPMLNHRQRDPNRSNYDCVQDLQHDQQRQLAERWDYLVHLHRLRHHHRHHHH